MKRDISLPSSEMISKMKRDIILQSTVMISKIKSDIHMINDQNMSAKQLLDSAERNLTREQKSKLRNYRNYRREEYFKHNKQHSNDYKSFEKSFGISNTKYTDSPAYKYRLFINAINYKRHNNSISKNEATAKKFGLRHTNNNSIRMDEATKKRLDSYHTNIIASHEPYSYELLKTKNIIILDDSLNRLYDNKKFEIRMLEAVISAVKPGPTYIRASIRYINTLYDRQRLSAQFAYHYNKESFKPYILSQREEGRETATPKIAKDEADRKKKEGREIAAPEIAKDEADRKKKERITAVKKKNGMLQLIPIDKPDGYKLCALQNEECLPLHKGEKTIAYGTNGKFLINKTSEDKIMCTDEALNDDIVNPNKRCYLKENVMS
jgi:hypothetical protein